MIAVVSESNRPQFQVGAVPGSLVRHKFAEESRTRLIEYDRSSHHDRFLEATEILGPPLRSPTDDARVRPRRTAIATLAPDLPCDDEAPHEQSNIRPVRWINVDGLANVELLGKLGKKYGLHPLALEDVVNVHQRAKTDAYEHNIYLVLRMPCDGERFLTEQVSLFLLDGLVITLQEYQGDCLNPVRDRLLGSKGRIRSRGADYLAYAIIDAIVDGYFPVLERYDVVLRAINDEIDQDLAQDIPKRLHAIRADLLNIRKVAQQHQDAVSTLLREETPLISDRTAPFLRDCLDHLARLIDTADTYRETCGELRELYFAQLGQKTNDVMKVLTIIATVFIPMSFIAGVYGMNFDSEVSALNMPELHWAFGYPFAILVMLCTGGGLLFYLRRKGWL